MLSSWDRVLLGFVKLDLGGRAVSVPVRATDPMGEPGTSAQLVSLECENDSCEIVVRGDVASPEVSRGMREAAERAVRHLSGRLLN